MATNTVNQQEAEELDRLYEQVMTCEPAIPKDQVDDLADMVFNKELFIRQWRLTAVLAGEGGAFYADLAEDEEKARVFAPLTGVLDDFAKRLRGMAEIAESASARIMVAGCNHENFIAWAEEAA
ncbi:hypothetical protein [Castellaniella sp.]|uniref:hypothetical protein n=1 Tax=Castellaniella sp. TaxID=1955812 RepID=UPI002AFE6847|nr:hypothetical protein [Castellaniella sp.]